MYIIAGLGNPEPKYDTTRHNVGFMTIDALSDESNISVAEIKHRALNGKGVIEGQKVVLVKPLTYMNLSGEAIGQIANYYKVDPTSEVIVISDDISLSPGQIRVRKKGSAGGHNGLKNIIAHLGTEEFIRIRVGIGDKPKDYILADYVMAHLRGEDKAKVDEGIKKAVEAIHMIITDGPDAAMNKFNTKVKQE